MAELDWGVRAGFLLTMKGQQSAVARDHFIGIKGSRIHVIEPWAGQDKRCAGFTDASHGVVMPGLINGHTHLPMSLFRGLADDLPFDKWLHGYILPLEAQMVDAEFVRAGTELSALELIRFGVTTVCDGYFFMDVVGQTLDRAGLRGIVGECVTDFPTPDTKGTPTDAYRILDRMRELFKDHERIEPAIAPHAPYSCSDETLKTAASYARLHGLKTCIHVSETASEVAESQKKYGKTPVARLSDLGVMAGPCVFAHCVHITAEDMAMMARAGTGAIHNPESNMKLSSGVAPVPAMMKAGVNVGLGTDGAASNNNLNMLQEMDTAAKLQKVFQHDNSAMGAAHVLNLATLSGAKALGLEGKIGSLEPGKAADLIVVGLHHPHMQPVHDVPSQLAYSATGLEVETVFCHGRLLFDRGEFKTLDAGRILREAEVWRERIRRKVEDLKP